MNSIFVSKLPTSWSNFRSVLHWLFPVFLGVIGTVAFGSEPDPEDCASWNAYLTRPGSPTLAEKEAFLLRLRPAVEAAEIKYGVPAAGLAAMAINESGYGFTRIALYAHNYFGFKFSGNNGQEGVDYYRLKCQPLDIDPDNRYIKFDSLEASIDYVASRLANSRYYRRDAEIYQAATVNGQNVIDRTNIWLASIADPYTGEPASYVRKLVRIMNDPISGSGSLSSKDNLYQYSGEVTVVPQLFDGAAYHSAVKVFRDGIALGGQYMDRDCEPFSDFIRSQVPAGLSSGQRYNKIAELWETYAPGYRGYPVKFCRYTKDAKNQGKPAKLEAHVLMLNATAERLAQWVATACSKIEMADDATCGRKTANYIWKQNNAQFAVRGFVVEPEGSAGGNGPDLVNLEFRDGITAVSVYTRDDGSSLHWSSEPIDRQEMLQAIQTPILETRGIARVANAQRKDYRATLGGELVGLYDKTDAKQRHPETINFHRANRDVYLAAFGSTSYALLNGMLERLGRPPEP